MQSYVQTELVECNRLRSQEALSNNNSNPALWNNTLSNMYELKAGDKVSMYSGFISEKGCGSLKTIEVKGTSLGKTKSFTYVEEQLEREIVRNIPKQSTTTETTTDIELFDNKVNLITGYYKNTNGTGYVGLPRKYINLEDSGSPGPTSGQATNGAFLNQDNTTNGWINPAPSFRFVIKDDFYIEPSSKILKVKNDNSKFTLFIANFSQFGINQSTGINSGAGDEPLDNYTVEPEYRVFYRYRKKIELEVPKGFNSAQFIAQDLTKQLQSIQETNDLIFSDNPDDLEENNETSNIPVSKTIESTTYRTFNCMTQALFTEAVYNSMIAGDVSTYYNNFQIVGWKRPELYTHGEKVNMNYSASGTELITTQDRLLGSSLRRNFVYTNANEPLRTSIPYTRENLELLKNFIQAQELYPEIWDSWNGLGGISPNTDFTYGDGTYYDSQQDISNTRYFHMNSMSNARMCEVDIVDSSDGTTEQYFVFGTNNAGQNTLKLDWDGSEGDKIKPEDYYAILITDPLSPPALTNAFVVSVVYDAPTNSQTLTFSVDLQQTLSNPQEVNVIKYSNPVGGYNYGVERTMLGSSLLRATFVDPNKAFVVDRYSKLLLIYYNNSDRDIYYDEPDINHNKLTYGCFTKESDTISIDGTDYTDDFINIHPINNTGKFSTNLSFAVDYFDRLNHGFIEAGRKFGYDMHFTATSNPAISLYNGKSSQYATYYGDQFATTFCIQRYNELATGVHSKYYQPTNAGQLNGFINRRYCGADNPQINWDGEHFSISDLHTSENLGSQSADGGRYLELITSGAGQTDFGYVTTGVSADASSVVYKINPRSDLNEYCPALAPYTLQQLTHTKNGTAGTGEIYVEIFNKNYTSYNIYDSKSGIIFEDMGFDEDTWDNSLWGIMGFSYNQFNGTTNRLSRIDNSNITNLKFPTTNAEIKITDTKNWNTNENGIPHFSDNIPCPFSLFAYNGSGDIANFAQTDQPFFQEYPELIIKTQSIQLTAENFPTSMIKGYYTIRSDIVPQSIFVGGRSNITNMPIVGIIDKMNPQSDYYFGTESNVDFTIGRPFKLSSICCSIHDPDGSFANVSNSSSIIFKIQRNINTSFNIVQEILEKKDKKNKL